MKTLLVLVGFLVYVSFIIAAARAADKLDAALREMSDDELAESSYWAGQGGHYPNPFSRERDRRAAEAVEPA